MRILIVILLVFLVDICVSDKHPYGDGDTSTKLHETVLIDSIEMKSYFINYKYFGTFDHSINYVEFDINSPSTGSVEGITVDGKNKYVGAFMVDNYVMLYKAEIHITATSNCKATLKMYTRKNYLQWSSMVDNSDTNRSLTIIYAKNALPAQKPFSQSSIGKRLTGDKLIYFQSRNVTNIGRFPSKSFEYAGNDYITYVGFSFNSPTAMALINTTFISEKEY